MNKTALEVKKKTSTSNSASTFRYTNSLNWDEMRDIPKMSRPIFYAV